jgi:hypothetical protein
MAPSIGVIVQCSSGNVYTADAFGFIPYSLDQLPKGDAVDMLNMGCIPFIPQHLGHTIGVDFNSTADQDIDINVPAGVKFRITRATVVNSTNPLDKAVGGIYTAPNKGGNMIVPATQSYAAIIGEHIALDLVMHSPESTWTWSETDVPCFFLSLTTPQGIQASADVYLWGDVFWPKGSEPSQVLGLESGGGSFEAENGKGRLNWG